MDDFETLLLANKLGVERWVKFHVSGPDAEDILQETYLAAYQAFPRLKDRTAFRPWLISIARNKPWQRWQHSRQRPWQHRRLRWQHRQLRQQHLQWLHR